jgi:hypothetical protein
MLSETYTSPVSEYVIAAGKINSPPFPFAINRFTARISGSDEEDLCNLYLMAASGNFANESGSLKRTSLVPEQLDIKGMAITKAKSRLPCTVLSYS